VSTPGDAVTGEHTSAVRRAIGPGSPTRALRLHLLYEGGERNPSCSCRRETPAVAANCGKECGCSHRNVIWAAMVHRRPDGLSLAAAGPRRWPAATPEQWGGGSSRELCSDGYDRCTRVVDQRERSEREGLLVLLVW